MIPKDFIEFWTVSNGDRERLAHYRSREKAVSFMAQYGEAGWLCARNTYFFADEIEASSVYLDVTLETEGDWVRYETLSLEETA